MSGQASKIRMEIRDGAAYITINNPDKLNCLDTGMLEGIMNALDKIAADPAVRVLLFQGAGDRAFSTGANLKEFDKLDKPGIAGWIRKGHRVFNAIESMSKPSVAVINGYAMGGGLELALACDIRIAEENAQFSCPELKHGWIPGWGALSRLRRLIGESNAKKIILLGAQIDVASAMSTGLVHKVFKKENLRKEIEGITDHFKNTDPFVIEMAKNALGESQRSTFGNDILFEVLATQYSKGKT